MALRLYPETEAGMMTDMSQIRLYSYLIGAKIWKSVKIGGKSIGKRTRWHWGY